MIHIKKILKKNKTYVKECTAYVFCCYIYLFS